MNVKRPYSIIFFIVLPLAILVVVRTTSTVHFKPDARKLAGASFTNSNTVSHEKLGTLGPGLLIIDLSDSGELLTIHPTGTVKIPFRSLLDKESQKMMHAHQGPVLLYSDEPGTSAKAWMLLSEMGYRNLFILTDDPDNEVMKYEFRPDSAQTGSTLR